MLIHTLTFSFIQFIRFCHNVFYSCAKMLFFSLGIANKISMSHLLHLVSLSLSLSLSLCLSLSHTHTHTHTCMRARVCMHACTYKGINASRNSHTFYFLVYKPVGCASGFWSPIDQLQSHY